MTNEAGKVIASLFDAAAVVRLNRGDVVCFRCPTKLGKEQRETAASILEGVFGKETAILILDGGQDIAIVRQSWWSRLWGRNG
jgi:hypothetical protein